MNIIIDGKICAAQRGEFILDVASRNGISIPTLCHSDALPGQGNCRLCLVEVIENNRSKMVTSCIFPVTHEVEVITNSEKIIRMRRTIIRLLSARAPHDEKLVKLREEYGIEAYYRFNVDESQECILCGLCVRACDEMGSSAISTVNRGVTKKVSTPYDQPSSDCIGCGACAFVCPTGAIKIHEENGKRTIWGRDFELVQCPRCGKRFATYEQIQYIKSGLDNSEYDALCDECRKKAVGEKLRDIFENVKVL